MTPEEAADFIRNGVRVTQPDVVAAKQFVLEQRATRFNTEALAETWAKAQGEPYPKEAPLYEQDPTPALNAFARYVSLRFAVFRAVWGQTEVYNSSTSSLTPFNERAMAEWSEAAGQILVAC